MKTKIFIYSMGQGTGALKKYSEVCI